VPATATHEPAYGGSIGDTIICRISLA